MEYILFCYGQPGTGHLFGHLLDIYWTFIGYLLDIYWTFTGHLLDFQIYWTLTGPLLDICWIFIGHGLNWTSAGHGCNGRDGEAVMGLFGVPTLSPQGPAKSSQLIQPRKKSDPAKCHLTSIPNKTLNVRVLFGELLGPAASCRDSGESIVFTNLPNHAPVFKVNSKSAYLGGPDDLMTPKSQRIAPSSTVAQCPLEGQIHFESRPHPCSGPHFLHSFIGEWAPSDRQVSAR